MDPLHNPGPKKCFVDMIFEAFQKRDDVDPLLQDQSYKGPQFSLIKPPRQPSNDTQRCGYFVCRYMMDIIKKNQTKIPINFINGAPPTYTKAQFNEVRYVWADYLLRHNKVSTDNDLMS